MRISLGNNAEFSMIDGEARIIELSWHGPFRLPGLLCDPNLRSQFNVAGVYLWVSSLPEHKRGQLSYVGKAGGRPTLIGRLLEHFVATVGGRNQIPRPDGSLWECRLDSSAAAEVLQDKSRFLQLVSDAFDYVSSFDIYLAPHEHDLKLVERNLIWQLKPVDNTASTRTAPSNTIIFRHRNALWQTLSMRQ